jgi:hypothetical protein
MKTLIIHPKDTTTDFLSTIYEGLDVTLINTNIGDGKLKEAIKSHDKIVMMGHGDEYGLFGFGRYIIDSSLVYLLRDKPHSVYIWCNANLFISKYELKGFHTGMIISEWDEALMYSVIPSKESISESNTLFAKAIKESIHLDPKDMAESAKKLYTTSGNDIIYFNQQNIHYA